MISLEKSVSTWQFPVNKVIKFGPCWEAPYLWLVTYWQWHYRISWENGGRITKTPALIAGTPFPFPSFVLFSFPFSLPFLRLSRRLAQDLIFDRHVTSWNELNRKLSVYCNIQFFAYKKNREDLSHLGGFLMKQLFYSRLLDMRWL